MTTTQKVAETRQPRLTRAVIRATGRDSLEDIARHGADAGFPGLTYYRDTVAFFRRNRKEILERAEQDAQEFGQDMLEMVAGFNCLKNNKLTPTEVGQALFSSRGEQCDIIQNAMAWYAAEEIARELNPDL